MTPCDAGALPAIEQAIVDEAKHDGEGWAIAPGADPAVVEALAAKGLARRHAGRWQLTPAGFALTPTFARAGG